MPVNERTGEEPWRLDAGIADVFRRGDGEVFALSRATHALTVIAALFAARRIAQPECWFPAYYCENGLPPLRDGKVRIRFYPVTPTIAPDWDACRKMLADGRPDLFVLPHFFGAENEAVEARAFCDAEGALLMEDGAHVLRPVGTMGQHGDFASYSPRKYFDMPDGGILVVRGATLAREVADAARDLTPRTVSVIGWRIEKLRAAVLYRRRRGPLRAVKMDARSSNVGVDPFVWMSPFSRAHLRRAGLAGADKVARQEGEVVRRIEAAVAPLGLMPQPRHPDSSPYLLGFRAATADRAQATLDQLRRSGAWVNSWPGMPPEVLAEPERYGAAMEIRRTLLRFTPRPAHMRRPLDFIDNLKP